MNGAPFSVRPHRGRRGFAREDEQDGHDSHGRTRGYNISYREGVTAAERVVKGRAFSGVYREGSGLELAGQIERAIAVMAWATLFAGLAVLFAITRHQTRRRLIGMTLLKVLGASPRDVTTIAALEFAALGLSASVLGVSLGFAGAAVLSAKVFDSPWVFSPAVPALIVLTTTLLCCAMGLLASRRTLAARPASLLNAD